MLSRVNDDGFPHVCPCVNLWDGGIHSEWINWGEWLSGSENRLKRVTTVRWESKRQLQHNALWDCISLLHGTVKPLFEHLWKSNRTEIFHNTIPFYTHYSDNVWMGLCQKIMRKHFFFFKWSFIQTIWKREEDGAGPSLETKLGFKRKFKDCSIKSQWYMSDC